MENQNKEVVQRLSAEPWTGENIDLVDELVSEEYVEYAPFGEVCGVEEYKDGIWMFTTAFPDIELQVEEMVAEGDTVAFRLSPSGTHEGPLMGVDRPGTRSIHGVRLHPAAGREGRRGVVHHGYARIAGTTRNDPHIRYRRSRSN